ALPQNCRALRLIGSTAPHFLLGAHATGTCRVGIPPVDERAVLTFEQDAFGCALQIVVLAVFQRPHEGCEADEAESDRNRNEKEEVDHSAGSASGGARRPVSSRGASRVMAFSWPRKRRAFATTMIEEADIAIAATSGVTWPSTATGIATTL